MKTLLVLSVAVAALFLVMVSPLAAQDPSIVLEDGGIEFPDGTVQETAPSVTASSGPVDLYVDAATGDDQNDGLSPTSAKLTIQAAVGTIPMVLGGDVTVHIADGTYAEQVALLPRSRTGFYFLNLLGNESSPDQVILDGGGTLEQGIVSLGLLVDIRGVTIRGFVENGLITCHGGTVNLTHSRLVENTGVAVEACNGAYLEIADCIVSGNSGIGIKVQEYASASVGPNVDLENNGGSGAIAQRNSSIGFRATCNIENDTLAARLNSSITGYGGCTLVSSSCVAQDSTGICVP